MNKQIFLFRNQNLFYLQKSLEENLKMFFEDLFESNCEQLTEDDIEMLTCFATSKFYF
jgi:hypothetical protein